MNKDSHTPKYGLAHKKALDILKDFQIADGPVLAGDVARELGIEVFEVKMPDNMKKLADFMDFDSNEILVNKDDHINSNSVIEQEANKFAEELLTPKKILLVPESLLRRRHRG